MMYLFAELKIGSPICTIA